MANKVYPKFGEAVLNGTIGDMRTSTFRVALLDSSYTYSDSHEFLNAISASARVATGGTNLAGVTTTDGKLDHSDFVFSSLSGSTVTQVVLFVFDAGGDAASSLAYYMDRDSSDVAISKAPSGGDFTVKTPQGWFTFGG